MCGMDWRRGSWEVSAQYRVQRMQENTPRMSATAKGAAGKDGQEEGVGI